MFIRRAQQICALSVVICLSVCSGSAFGAAPVWQVTAQHRGGLAFDMSCSNATSCMTVGLGLLPSVVGGKTQLFHSSLRRLPMGAVACRGGRCLEVAGGFGGLSFGIGGRISVQWVRGTHRGKVKHLGKTFGSLAGVSCPSKSDCFAVGSTQPFLNVCIKATKQLSFSQIDACLQSRPLFAHWHSGHWHLSKSFPLPPAVERVIAAKGNVNAELEQISCSSNRSCEVVGHWQTRTLNSNHPQPFAAHWDGRKWTLQRIGGKNAPRAGFAALSCAHSGSCMAVSDHASHKVTKPTVLRYNGTRWSVLHVSVPSGLKGEVFTDVSCPAANECMFVGGQQIPKSRMEPLAEVWKSGHWTFPQVALPRILGPHYLAAVDCQSTTSCVAIGNDDRHIGIDRIFGWFTERYALKA